MEMKGFPRCTHERDGSVFERWVVHNVEPNTSQTTSLAPFHGSYPDLAALGLPSPRYPLTYSKVLIESKISHKYTAQVCYDSR